LPGDPEVLKTASLSLGSALRVAELNLISGQHASQLKVLVPTSIYQPKQSPRVGYSKATSPLLIEEGRFSLPRVNGLCVLFDTHQLPHDRALALTEANEVLELRVVEL